MCTLDLEDHATVDPAARRMAGDVLKYALHSPLAARASKVTYVGGATGAAWLDKIGVDYESSSRLDAHAELVIIGDEAQFDEKALRTYLENGGKAFFLPRAQADGWLGVKLKPTSTNFAGSVSVPVWPEARGLSASDLRWRCYLDHPFWILSGGAETGADGLIGRRTVGKGVAIFCQLDPDCFHADEKTYFRYTRWRTTRAVAQLLANLGASFSVDNGIFHPLDPSKPRPWAADDDRPGPQATGPKISQPVSPGGPQDGSQISAYYYPDYRADFPMGDNPYRYYRW